MTGPDSFDDTTDTLPPGAVDVDWVLVDRALAGERVWRVLNRDERAEAATQALRRHSLSRAAALLHVNNRTLKAVLAPAEVKV